ncbi:hypothetical protein PG994_005190 [Apiospora phragmitis]|uniref:AB hydrolase-1 domain-containing protein n=1 Tax=Apiospora phragmitis TaxID=2905665 RepID=A0ABR1VSR8_9PEZI
MRQARGPLDWLSSESLTDDDNNTPVVTLAIIARPATVSESDPRHGGTIIVNPGGPSASGVGFMLRAGELVQRTVDSEEELGGRHYEILSFDPRGVGLTEPRADCFGGDEFARGVAWWTDRGLGAVGEAGKDGEGRVDIDTVRRAMARAEGFGRLCEARNKAAGGEGGIWGFMSTSSVARDMVAIVDKLEELRKKTLAVDAAAVRTVSDEDEEAQLRIELRSAGDEKEEDTTPRIQFWGFSYGSALGNYFASMFPGRVGRMILEGVEDVHDYHSASWGVGLLDTQHVLDHFWETCFRGREACALYQRTDPDAAAIRDRVHGFLDSLGAEPAPYVSRATNTFVAVTKHDVLDAVLRPLYRPLRDFPALARLLSEALQGNLTLLYSSLNRASTHKDSCSNNSTDLRAYTWGPDAMTAVACGDGEPQDNLTATDFADYVADLQKRQNADFAFLEAQVRLGCSGWRIRPKYRFDGPWTTPPRQTKMHAFPEDRPRPSCSCPAGTTP